MRLRVAQSARGLAKSFCTSCTRRKWMAAPQQVYTGRYRHFPSRSVYQEQRVTENMPSRDEMEVLLRDRQSCEAVLGRRCLKMRYKSGDFIEVRRRDGTIELGVVSNNEAEEDTSRLVRYRLVNGVEEEDQICEKRDVSFMMRGMVPSPSDRSLSLVRLIINDAVNLSYHMKPYWRAVYAQLARQGTIQALDINLMVQRAFDASRNVTRLDNLHAIKLLAGYLGFSNFRVFNRIGNDSPLFAMSETAADGELDGQSLPAFMRHYAALPDDQSTRLVGSAMSQRFPERDSESWLTNPNNVLNYYLENHPRHPMLFVGSLGWRNKHGELADDLDPAIGKSLLTMKPSKDPVKRRVVNDPVYAFSTHDDIAFSISQEGSDKTRLSIHVPDISHITTKSTALMNQLILRNKSMRIDELKKSLIPKKLRKSAGFNSSRDGMEKTCLTFSVTVDLSNPGKWHNSNGARVEVEHTRILDWLKLDANDTELALGWKYRQVGEQLYDESDFHPSVVTFGKFDRQSLMQIRDLLEKFHYARIEPPTVVYHHTPPNALTFEHAPPSETCAATIDRMVREARITAGQIAAIYASEHNIVLPFMSQRQRRINERDQLAILDQGDAKAYFWMVENLQLESERVLARPEPHHGLGAPRGYVSVAYPFDDILDIYTQWVLRQKLSGGDEDDVAGSLPTPRNKPRKSTLEFIQSTRAQTELIDWYTNRVKRFDFLTRLQHHLQESQQYYIFRCTVLQTAEYPQISIAYCQELDTLVEIVLNPRTHHVDIGDRVVCNEILELSPIEGLLVLSI